MATSLEDNHPLIPFADEIDTQPLPIINLDDRQLDMLRSVFGAAPLPTHVTIGPMAWCSFDDDTGECEIVLPEDFDDRLLVHEVAHYVCFKHVPELALRSSREKHELMADVFVAAWKHGVQFNDVEAIIRSLLDPKEHVT